ncbi:Alkaline protease secretion ATP-binding protein AprD [Candidatus Accumulibacter aalborgensis]|uniref:Alkaline protease secretion ATP-binding protein AprD n=1 Tax=Candidatus Accumulibacter aalborgensis TaxID=1860102 RepID=A0A1A8XTG1_9PROT|nr:type I secretion system permease/ATPase [Candidatus Accumulibacter aalborgensis]SBT08355.1 Alkaline protease secretion ATP-binding protein AprD [Candidatus Accumulibacter aalborgensis]
MKTPSFFQRSELTATLWSFRREFLVVGIFSLVINLLMLTPTIYMLQVYDRFMTSHSELTLIAVSLITLFLLAVMAFAEWSRSRLLVRLGVRLDERLSSRVFNACFESHLNQSRDNPVQAFSNLTNIRQFLTGNGIFAFFDAPWTPIYLLVLFMLHPSLGMLSLLFAAILTGLAIFSHRQTQAPTQKTTEAGVAVGTYLHSKLRNAQVIEALGMLGGLRRRWLARHQQHMALNSASQDIQRRIQAFSKFVRYSQQSLMLGAGALLVIKGELTVGGMIAANVLMSRALQPIDAIVGSWSGWQSARKAFESLEALLRDHPKRPAGMVHEDLRGEVRIENLVATATNRSQPILAGLSAEFPAGEVIAIVGPSGSGKSTLARCLVGIWPEVQGSVLLDGKPIESLDRGELGPFIGYLPQDIELFEGSVAENIARFGEIDPTKVIEAAQRTGIHDMTLRFPRGYDTPMGEAGSFLSGGQRQRIGLARAMYGNPSLIVLDEPNANLDDVGETALIVAIKDLKAQGVTVFLITHRMNILGVADRILVLNNGEIQIYGTRQQVLAAAQPPVPAANSVVTNTQPA